MIKVVLIGSGNVAQHLIKVLHASTSVSLVQAFARKKEVLSHLLPLNKITSTYKDIAEADVYIISVSDNAIAEVSANLPFQNRLVVHTSGSSELSVLDSKNRKGVFYPLQTFSKSKEIDLSEEITLNGPDNTATNDMDIWMAAQKGDLQRIIGIY